MSRQEIANALQALLAAPTPADGVRVFLEHGELLKSPVALELIEKNIGLASDDPGLVASLRNRGHLVSEFQRAGLDAVREAMIEPDDIRNAVMAWLNCDDIAHMWEHLNTHHQMLVTSVAADALEHVAQQYADQPEALARVNNCKGLRAIAMTDGIVAARRYVGQQVADALSRTDASRTPEQLDSLHRSMLRLIDAELERDAWISANLNFGIFLSAQTRHAEAIAALEAALAGPPMPARRAERFRAHYEIGLIATTADAWDAELAKNHLRAALDIGPCEGQRAEFLLARVFLTIVCLAVGDHASATTQLDKVLNASSEYPAGVWAHGMADTATNLTQDHSVRRQHSLAVAIKLFLAALEEISVENEAETWAAHQQTLAMAYRDIQSDRRGQSLQKALHHTNEALSVWTKERDAYQWARLQHNLGTIYFLHIDEDAYGNLLNARRCLDAALDIHTRDDHPNDWAMTKSTQAACAFKLHEVRGDPAFLDQAIDEAAQSLEWWSADDNAQTRRAQLLQAEAHNVLGSALVERSAYSDVTDLRAGIGHLTEAAQAYADLHAVERRRDVLMNLARSYSTLSETDDEAFEQAADYARRALSFTSRESDAYLWAFFQRNYAALLANTGESTYTDEALDALHCALAVFQPELFRSDYVQTQGFVGQIHFNAKRWGEALAAYTLVIDKTDALMQGHYTEAGRRHQIAETSRYFINAAYCLAQLQQFDASLVMLERGKARALVQQMATANVVGQLCDDDGELASAWHEIAELEEAMRSVSSAQAPRDDVALAAALRAARERVKLQLAERDVLVDPALDLPDVFATAPDGGALVAVLVTLHGAMAFIIPGGCGGLTDEHVVRASVTTNQLHSMLVGGKRRAGLVRLSMRAKHAKDRRAASKWRREYARQLDNGCRVLWDALLKPVFQRLNRLGVERDAPLVFLPQGGLGMLPLHAARDARVQDGQPGQRPFLNYYSVSYAPNAFVLRAAQKELANNDREQAVNPSVLAVLNPTGDLSFADLEGGFVASGLASQEGLHVLRHAQATAAAVKEKLSAYDYLHFACHGSFDLRHPERSALRLANGERLELSELTSPGIDLTRCRLVTLSACETGMIEIQQTPDEYIGLPAALLKAGAPAVLGTLWEVDDLASAMMVGEFYRQHLIHRHSPAHALTLAQRWLSTARQEAIADWLEKRLTELDGLDTDLSATSATIADTQRRLASGEMGAVPFAHPWFWAAFTVTGV